MDYLLDCNMYLIDNRNRIQNAIKYIKLYSRKYGKQPWLY